MEIKCNNYMFCISNIIKSKQNISNVGVKAQVLQYSLHILVRPCVNYSVLVYVKLA